MLKDLTKDRAVVLAVDIQERLLPAIANKENLEENCLRILKTAAVLRMPVLYTEQYPKGLGRTVSSLKQFIPDTVEPFEKMAFSCCDETGFCETLKKQNCATVIVFGIETHICVLFTIADLLSQGYKIVLAADACGSREIKNHHKALEVIQSWGALVLPTESIVYRLIGAAGSPEFRALLPLFK